MGWVPPGHTSFFSCVRPKNAKNGLSAETLEQYFNVYALLQYFLGRSFLVSVIFGEIPFFFIYL